MKTYVACISGEAVLAFRAEDDDEARAMIDDQEGGMRSDLKALVGADGKPLWHGKSVIQAQEATAAQHAEWEQSRDQAISDEEIDLDAGDKPSSSIYFQVSPFSSASLAVGSDALGTRGENGSISRATPIHSLRRSAPKDASPRPSWRESSEQSRRP